MMMMMVMTVMMRRTLWWEAFDAALKMSVQESSLRPLWVRCVLSEKVTGCFSSISSCNHLEPHQVFSLRSKQLKVRNITSTCHLRLERWRHHALIQGLSWCHEVLAVDLSGPQKETWSDMSHVMYIYIYQCVHTLHNTYIYIISRFIIDVYIKHIMECDSVRHHSGCWQYPKYERVNWVSVEIKKNLLVAIIYL